MEFVRDYTLQLVIPNVAVRSEKILRKSVHAGGNTSISAECLGIHIEPIDCEPCGVMSTPIRPKNRTCSSAVLKNAVLCTSDSNAWRRRLGERFNITEATRHVPLKKHNALRRPLVKQAAAGTARGWHDAA